MKPCRHCNGTGLEVDHSIVGREMRALRVSAGLPLSIVAYRLNVSIPYLSDLERGNRNWNNERIERFKKALNNVPSNRSIRHKRIDCIL